MSEFGIEQQIGSSVQGLTFIRPLPQVQNSASTGGGSDGSSIRPQTYGLAERLFPARTALDSGVYPPVSGLELAHFVIEERIGRGGMGAVFRAIDKRLDRVVALKILSPDFANDSDAVIRFQNEARSAAKLDHDNIARVFYNGSEGPIHFIAFEFVTGTNIRSLINQKGRLSSADAVNYTLQIAEALRQTNAANVVHRDIKPSNIIVSSTGRAKLVDLGLARMIDPQASRDLTVAGTALGTFDYIAPEQAMDARNVDVRSDLYSLGCTLYHMLTGAPPYPTGTMFEKVMNHHRPVPPNPTERVADISPQLAAIVQKLMASNPDERYATPDLLIADLIPVAHSLGLEPSPAESMIWASPVPPATRSRWQGAPAWGAVAMLLLMLVLADRLRLPQRSSTVAQLRLKDDGVPVVTDTSPRSVAPLMQDESGSAPLRVPEYDQPDLPATPMGASVVSNDETTPGIPGTTTTRTLPGTSEQEGTNRLPVRLNTADKLWNEPLVNLFPTLVPPGGENAFSPSTPAMIDNRDETISDTGRPSSNVPNGGTSPDSVPARSMSSSSQMPAVSGSPTRRLVVTEPFVVIDPATNKRYPCSTLSAACALAKDTWAIEVQLNANPLIQQEAFVINDKQIRIRPARDFQPGRDERPLIRFDLTNQRMIGSYSDVTDVIRLNRGSLEIYDVDIELVIDPESISEWSLITLVNGSQLTATGASITIVNPFNIPTTGVLVPENESRDLTDLMPERMMPRSNKVELQDCVVRGQFDFLVQQTSDPLNVTLRNTAVAVAGRLIQIDGSSSYHVGTQQDANRAVSLTLENVTAVTGNGLLKATSGEHGMLPLMKVTINNGVFRVDATDLPLIEISGNESSDRLRQAFQTEAIRNRSFVQSTGPLCLIHSSTSLLQDAEQELGPEASGLPLTEVSPESRIVLRSKLGMNKWHSVLPSELDLKQALSNPAIEASGDRQNAGVNWQTNRIPRLTETSAPSQTDLKE
ncbi:MAG TPA: serine/threonine-protein kinase [Planctomicrobium sp.]|nr:serine/threonine-protein kinase [Planctomicrobium sp.]